MRNEGVPRATGVMHADFYLANDMDINKFINELDKLYEAKRIKDVEPFLEDSCSGNLQRKSLGTIYHTQ